MLTASKDQLDIQPCLYIISRKSFRLILLSDTEHFVRKTEDEQIMEEKQEPISFWLDVCCLKVQEQKPKGN